MNNNPTIHTHKWCQQLNSLPASCSTILIAEFGETPFSMLSAQTINKLQNASGLTQAELGLALLPLATCFAVAPVSEFYVGAVAFDSVGNAYFGANFEFANTHIGQTIHAEQSAIANAWQQGAKDLALLVINYPPCGHCRQFINEVKLADDFHIQLPNSEAKPLSYYLPEDFSPKDLGIDERVLAANCDDKNSDDKNSDGKNSDGKNSDGKNSDGKNSDGKNSDGKNSDGKNGDDKNAKDNTMPVNDNSLTLEDVAKLAHDNSHAPYSGNKNGIALLYEEGKDRQVVSGRYAENCAFNPSLPALQVALNTRRLQGKDWQNIQRAVMVETKTVLSQYDNASALLKEVSAVDLELLYIVN